MKTSIIMTSYNYESFIAKAIESVINQSIKDWELIIVDDGSQDKSIDIIQTFCQKDDRIKLYTHPDGMNHGLCEAIKLGLEKAENNWVAFLESDDVWAETYLEKKLEYIEQNPNCSFVYNDIELIGDKKQIKNKKNYLCRVNALWKNNFPKDVFKYFGKENIVPTFSCVMCKKDTLLNLDFNPTTDACLDYWLWWQYSENNLFGYINEKLIYWQLHSKSYLTKRGKNYSHLMKRAIFVCNLIKLFQRKPKLSAKNTLLKQPLIAKTIYTLIFIKKLFITR